MVKVKVLRVKDTKRFVAFRTTLRSWWHLCRAPPTDQWKNDEVTARYNTVITANASGEDLTLFPFLKKKGGKSF